MTTAIEESNRAVKLKKQNRMNLPWNPDMMLALLKQVHVHGAHLIKRGSITSSKAWKEVNVQLFREPCMAQFQSSYEEDPRKIRDKFDSILASTTSEKETGIFDEYLSCDS